MIKGQEIEITVKGSAGVGKTGLIHMMATLLQANNISFRVEELEEAWRDPVTQASVIESIKEQETLVVFREKFDHPTPWPSEHIVEVHPDKVGKLVSYFDGRHTTVAYYARPL